MILERRGPASGSGCDAELVLGVFHDRAGPGTDAAARGRLKLLAPMTTTAMPPTHPFGAPGAVAWDIDRQPVVVAWEVTRACQYRCTHCRADAHPHPDPNELYDGGGTGADRPAGGVSPDRSSC